jgi:hypothetical protein
MAWRDGGLLLMTKRMTRTLVSALALGLASASLAGPLVGVDTRAAQAQTAAPAASVAPAPASPLVQSIQREAAVSTQARILMDFYGEEGAAPIWVTAEGATSKATDMVAALQDRGRPRAEP